MNKEDLKDKVLGNYLGQKDSDFPLDCETFDYIQNNNFITEMLGNIAGDKCFIYGCEKSGTNNYAPGYVFLRTTDHPEGEILPFGGGSSSGRVYINSQEVSVTANDKTYDPAYTKRRLSFVTTQYDKIIAEQEAVKKANEEFAKHKANVEKLRAQLEKETASMQEAEAQLNALTETNNAA